MEKLSFVKWDSDFFNKKIGRITLNSNISDDLLAKQFDIAIKEGYSMVYLFTETDFTLSPDILTKYNGDLVDTKVVYKKSVTNEVLKPDIKLYSCLRDGISNNILDLALLSGKYSRFKIDENFSDEDFKRLYHEWVRKSISGEIADEVYQFNVDGITVGFVTVSISNNTGVIGLIAVDKNFQGKNIGGKLLARVNSYLSKRDIHTVNVSTQKQNIEACSFYVKNNFKIFNEQNIYHFNL